MIKGEKVYLRSLEAEDLSLMYLWENDPQYWSLSNTIIPFNKSTLKEYVTAFHDLIKDEQFRYLICRTDNDAPIGCIDLFEYHPIHRRIGVGILIYKEKEKKQGFANESIHLISLYLKKHLNIKNIYCNILADNLASIKLFENNGFEHIGTKKGWHYKDSEFIDEHFYQKHF